MNTPPVKPPVEAETLDPFDRRAGNREATKWVRDALNEQSGKIDKIAEEVHGINAALQRSWQDGDPVNHWKEHELFKEREAERQRLEAKRMEEEAKRREFWEKIKADVLSYALKAMGLFVVGVVVLGTQAKFKEWVQWAVTDNTKQEAAK
jgi:hypothetical protein